MKIDIKFDPNKLKALKDKTQRQISDAVEQTVKETDGVACIKEGYDNSQLRVQSAVLRSSFKQEKTKYSIKVWSDIIYARIQDLGGYAGRNHASYIPPTKYFTDGAERLKKLFYTNLRQNLKPKK